jgi:oxaloacetate decarboxylase (Na+ extruding) subunit alpha
MANRKSDTSTGTAPIPLRITDTTLRDAHQSLWATRMRLEDILEIVDVIDSAGYYSLEVWGGATFDVCLRFLRENPWERLRQIKKRAPKTPLQMLLRGQNILGYKNYPDDLLDRFVELACYNGIDIFRIFDALNDVRNLAYAIDSVKKHGGHAQGTISYTISPYHTIEKYVKIAKDQVDLGIDTLCIKDMAGILSPIGAEKLIKALVSEVKVPIQLHCHCSSGMATATYVEAVRAGAGAIDCAISPLAGFSSQPPVETLVSIFDETDFSTGIDTSILQKIAHFFTDLTPKMKPDHGHVSIIDPEVLLHQIPGGMISNLRSQLAQQKALDRLSEVYEEIPRVRADLGFPPLVTPTSQIVGTQAVLNVLAGERFKIVPNEIKNYARGLYGRSPQKLSKEFVTMILGDEKPVTGRPADTLEPMLPHATDNLDSTLIEHEEDIISYCLFPEQSLEFFKWRALPEDERSPAPVELEIAEREGTSLPSSDEKDPPTPQPLGVTPQSIVSSDDYAGVTEIMSKMGELGISELVIRKGDVSIELQSDASAPRTAVKTPAQTQSEPEAAPTEPTSQAAPAEPAADALTIDSPLVGTFYSAPSPGKPSYVTIGDTVAAGVTVGIVEAMKLINEIKTTTECRVVQMLAVDGDSVDKGQPLFSIEEV